MKSEGNIKSISINSENDNELYQSYNFERQLELGTHKDTLDIMDPNWEDRVIRQFLRSGASKSSILNNYEEEDSNNTSHFGPKETSNSNLITMNFESSL